MTSDLEKVRNWMESSNRRVFFYPPNQVPFTLKVAQVERILVELWRVADDLGISLGQRPIILECHKPEVFYPIAVADINELYREVLALIQVLGVAPSAERIFLESFNPFPNFKRIIKDTYYDLVSDEETPDED
ncbi:MAG: hypothetical protein WC932_06195 [archaeon]|jgi:hypothetical protein